jgi:hypothetical protein
MKQCQGDRIRRAALAVLPLATGVALLLHIYLGGPLLLMVATAGSLTWLAAYLVWRRCPPALKAELLRRIRGGVVAGLAATAAYDLIRWLLLLVFHLTFQPFDIFFIFGKLLLAGFAAPHAVVMAAGMLFHWVNGVGFAIGYSILFGYRGWWAGLLWALGLEAVMLAVYPGWLDIRAIAEFRSISMTGHVVYGVVLGEMARRVLDLQGGGRS